MKHKIITAFKENRTYLDTMLRKYKIFQTPIFYASPRIIDFIREYLNQNGIYFNKNDMVYKYHDGRILIDIDAIMLTEENQRIRRELLLMIPGGFDRHFIVLKPKTHAQFKKYLMLTKNIKAFASDEKIDQIKTAILESENLSLKQIDSGLYYSKRIGKLVFEMKNKPPQNNTMYVYHPITGVILPVREITSDLFVNNLATRQKAAKLLDIGYVADTDRRIAHLIPVLDEICFNTRHEYGIKPVLYANKKSALILYFDHPIWKKYLNDIDFGRLKALANPNNYNLLVIENTNFKKSR